MGRVSTPIGYVAVRKHLKGDAAFYIDLPLALTIVLGLRVDDRLAYYPLNGGGIGFMKETDAALKLEPDACVELLEKHAMAKRKRRGYDETYETVLQRKLRHEREVEELIAGTRTPEQKRMIEEQERGGASSGAGIGSLMSSVRDFSKGFGKGTGIIGEARRNLRQMIEIDKKRQNNKREAAELAKQLKEVEAAVKLKKQQKKRLKGESEDEDGEQD